MPAPLMIKFSDLVRHGHPLRRHPHLDGVLDELNPSLAVLTTYRVPQDAPMTGICSPPPKAQIDSGGAADTKAGPSNQ
jgi:hypothetical protein